MTRSYWLVVALCCALGCGDDDGNADTSPADASDAADTSVDSSGDVGSDGGVDGGVDGSVDGGTDSGDSGDDSGDDSGGEDTTAPPVDDCPDDPNKLVPGACGCGTPDVDSDLDGLADCEDDDPNAAFAGAVIGEAGSRAPIEEHVRGFAAGGWDGRLYIGLRNRRLADDSLEVTYTAELFRPEALRHDAAGRPDFADVDGSPNAFANRMIFSNDPAEHGFHVSICADPAFAENPYPSDADGEFAPDGDHETYRIGIIGMDQGVPDEYLKSGRGHVVVANPRTPSASIVAAELDGSMQEMRTLSGSRLHHYEPSVTPDCRLVVWHGLVNNDPTRPASIANYSVNANFGATGWSEPRSITDMYYVHGPGAASEAEIAGVPFSERYPVAKEPMRDYDGTVIPEGQFVFGPYPWISFDGSEIFFPSSINFDGPARAAVTVVGQRTGYALRHIDGAANPSRSNLVPNGNAVIFANSELGREVRSAYQMNTLGDGRPLGTNGYQRLFFIPIALTQSMWTSQARNGPDVLPETNRQGVYAFFLSHSNRYIEVDLHQQEDAHYVLYLPMNEQIARDPALMGRILRNEFSRAETWAQKRLAWDFETDVTPDVSGLHHRVTLRAGAEFPYEHNNAYATFQAAVRRFETAGTPMTGDAVAGDRIHGIVGNAVYFRGGSTVHTTLNAEARGRLSGDVTLSLWVKPLTARPSYDLLNIGNARLRLSEGTVEFTLGGATLRGHATTTDRWTHVLVTISDAGATLYQDGIASATSESATRLGAALSVVVGPSDSGASETLCLIDEVAVSDVAREPWEIDEAALRLQTRGEDPVWDRALPDELAALPPELPVGFTSPTDAQVELGARLFADPILSLGSDNSCSTCHVADLAFTDGRERSMGIGITPRNAPTVANRLFSRAQFADGRARSLEEQALEPIGDPLELGLGVDNALARLNASDIYRPLFETAYGLDGAPIGRGHLAGAIAAFERTLVSANSRFDSGHFTPAELRGRGLFFGRARCAGCHRGANFTDEEFHAIGFDTREPQHEGRAAITGRARDLGRFRTPTLREIARTAPYFHDGSEETLMDVVEFYNDGGDEVHDNRDVAIQPLGLNETERGQLVAFLRTLTGTTLPTADGVVTRPRIGASGVPGGMWIVGLDYGDAPSVVLRDMDGEVLATIATADLTLTPSVTPPGWSGAWSNITLAPPTAALAELDARGITVEVVNEDGASDRYPLSR